MTVTSLRWLLTTNAAAKLTTIGLQSSKIGSHTGHCMAFGWIAVADVFYQDELRFARNYR